ncbi:MULTISPECIES: DUF2986 domain-containing protein [Shewanella]|uniref:DUF2986 domain-containing protein n=1 Tax=Shewanella japonica TaxID=93973 RepID=A0ABM6JR23_9GAMM|nr:MULTISPECIES: DUF2986 domain-containing protein [Shewanella]ARD24274.1 hypothetical protein SJ2017_4046 [Shewanella japonica]
MNRRKKINQTLKGKAKKANAKKAGASNKPKYISKADRAVEEQAAKVLLSAETADLQGVEDVKLAESGIN